MAARWLLLHPARVRGGAGAGDAILGVSSLGWGCTVAPSGSAQPQEESHSQRQGEGEEGWAAAEGAHVACGGVWSGGGDSCDHSPLVRLAKGLEKKTRKSGIAPNRSGQQHGVEPPPPRPLNAATLGAERSQGDPNAHAAPSQAGDMASSPLAGSPSHHTQKSLLASGFSHLPSWSCF